MEEEEEYCRDPGRVLGCKQRLARVRIEILEIVTKMCTFRLETSVLSSGRAGQGSRTTGGCLLL